MGSALEVERKLSVGPEFALPPLEAVPGVAGVSDPEISRLEATYWDTDDLQLARNAITLRRRTGGSDAGWHLKLPAGTERIEIGRPLGRVREVPEDLADLVAVHLRGAALRPVARLQTLRTAYRLRDAEGADAAEVVDDYVHAQTLGEPGAATGTDEWREVEVELKGTGDRALLDAVGQALRAAGARPAATASKLARLLGPRLSAGPDLPPPAGRLTPRTPAGEVVGAYVRAQVAALLAADPRVRRHEEDAVHKMRVASRRLRSTFTTFRSLLGDGAALGDLDAELRRLAAVLGASRDREVLLDRLRAELAAQPSELVLGPVAARIEQTLLPELLRAREEGVAELRGERYYKLVEALLDLVARLPRTGPAAGRARDVLPPLVRRVYRRLAKRVAAAEHAPPGQARDVAYHDARKAAKRLRYAAEALAPAFGPDAAALARQAEAVQEVLGERQDAVVARPVLRELGLAAQAAEGENGFTFGLLLGVGQCRATLAERDLAGVWRQASRRRYHRWLG